MRKIQRQLPRRPRRRFRGTELLELGLVLGTILLPLTFGMIEGGYYFYIEQNIQGAAREGARAAIVATNTTDAQREAAAEDAIAGIINSASLKDKNGNPLPFSIDYDTSD